ncbi:MAG: hypothetical protein A3G32_01090 [Deltaproteobacteria bacterium RIFCSPLOWO2_12_FULL_40_28]|nr:MAG: hypothetical protein A3C45_09975 [Deltaproteobacteria bacterium RIFCSPHIGHO2_02_FULL_40_28]OGQ19929.1 MAG: hypothetical protein A3E27_06925 [Deltaproteobacteria bacterium RIFCSPHIGHO2_12_FULL_40_32]OGQ39688.1 MAG: hypothetical protein A3I69_06355 [Deltaproteobacteria bacterium RIFCSPLOWO2_02_FULL_40_36]OGQ52944.1 MAG: hypothetical protein A3G32_01090 [Deltaproteobacteria bacterium RIFCSPLOWO2_12_FULL_40_28]
MIFNNIIEKLLTDPIHLRVFKTLRLHPEGLTGRTLGVLVKTSSFKINGVVRFLVALGVITQTVVGRAHLYRLNEHHILIQDVINYLIDYETNLLNKLGETIMDQLPRKPLSIILYGSIARGDEAPLSDVDLLLIYKDNAKPGLISQTAPMIEWINRNYGNTASIRQVFISEFQKPEPEHKTLIRNIIKEGKSIAGLTITEILNYHDKNG